MRLRQTSCRQRIETRALQLNALGPQQVLQRGYTITTVKKTGEIIRSAAAVTPGDKLVTRFHDGTVETIVQNSRQLSLFE